MAVEEVKDGKKNNVLGSDNTFFDTFVYFERFFFSYNNFCMFKSYRHDRNKRTFTKGETMSDEIKIDPKAKYPIKNPDGSWNFKNLFRIDWKTIIFILWILYMAWAYKQDTSSCMYYVEHPREYCDAYCDTRNINSEEPLFNNDVPNVELNFTSVS